MKNYRIILLTLILCSNVIHAQEMWNVDRCMDYAVKNSPTTYRQLLEEDNARRDLLEAKLGFLPSFSASSSADANFGRSINPETNTYATTSNFGNSYRVYGSLPIFEGLNTINQYKIASVAVKRGAQEVERINNQIAIETMNLYYTAIFSYGTLHIARENLKTTLENYKKKKIENEIGLASISEVAQLESDVSQERLNIIDLETEYKKALLTLKEKMFFPLEKELYIDTSLNIVPFEVEEKEDALTIYDMALSYLPEMKIAEMKQKESFLKYKTAQWAMVPYFTLNGGISTAYSREIGNDIVSESFSKQLKNRMGQYVGISMNIPIFSALNRRMNVKRQKNEYKLTTIEVNETENSIKKMVLEGYLELESCELSINQSIINVKSNEFSNTTVQKKFDEGLVGVIDLKTTQAALVRAKIDKLKAILNYKIQRRVVDYYKGIPIIRN